VEFINSFLLEAQHILAKLNHNDIDKAVRLLVHLKQSNGRLFILGVGGSAANASHAVNDFRKIVGIESYAPTDNVSELTARTNDEGWNTVFTEWLRVSRLNHNDMLLILSVGGGDERNNVSVNIVNACKYAKKIGSKIIGIVSRNGGFTATVANACITIPVVSESNTTPHAEAFQAIIWHLLVSHPALKSNATKWETVNECTV
jgi:D-sedoheptulose 7-phosphate isomerase